MSAAILTSTPLESITALMSEHGDILHELQSKVETLLKEQADFKAVQAVMQERMKNWEERFALRSDFEKQMGEITKALALTANNMQHLTEKTDEIDKSVKGVLAAFENKIHMDAQASSWKEQLKNIGLILATVISIATVFGMVSGWIHIGQSVAQAVKP